MNSPQLEEKGTGKKCDSNVTIGLLVSLHQSFIDFSLIFQQGTFVKTNLARVTLLLG